MRISFRPNANAIINIIEMFRYKHEMCIICEKLMMWLGGIVGEGISSVKCTLKLCGVKWK